MGLQSKARGSESRFCAYVEALTSVLGHADPVMPFRSYCGGLLLPGDRKSVEPMAARVQPARVHNPNPGADRRRHRHPEEAKHSVGVAQQ